MNNKKLWIFMAMLVISASSIITTGCGASQIENFLANRDPAESQTKDSPESNQVSDKVANDASVNTGSAINPSPAAMDKTVSSDQERDASSGAAITDLTDQEINIALLKANITEYLAQFADKDTASAFEYVRWSEQTNQSSGQGDKVLDFKICATPDLEKMYYTDGKSIEIYANKDKEMVYLTQNDSGLWYKNEDIKLCNVVSREIKDYLPYDILEQNINYIKSPDTKFTITKIQVQNNDCYKVEARQDQQVNTYYLSMDGEIITFSKEDENYYGEVTTRIWYEIRKMDKIKPQIERVQKKDLQKFLDKNGIQIFASESVEQ